MINNDGNLSSCEAEDGSWVNQNRGEQVVGIGSSRNSLDTFCDLYLNIL